MPLPELGLSLSVTDNAGSPMYAGHGEFQKMSEYDSAIRDHKIIITISDEPVNEIDFKVDNPVIDKITLPTYKMMVTDDKTQEKTLYEVTRDSFLLDQMAGEEIGGFSFLGINLFKKKIFTLPAIAFEPLSSSIEVFEVSKFRTKKEEYLSYILHRNKEQAVLLCGKPGKDFFNKIPSEFFFYVVDHNDGQKFLGDISYREKFIKSIPKVEIHLIKRLKNIKEYKLDKKGKVSKIIYI